MLLAEVAWSFIFVVVGFGAVVGVNTNNGVTGEQKDEIL
jgi:hypothetical protein